MTSVTGVNVTKFEATAAESQPNMFTVPMVGVLKVIPGAPHVFELKDKTIILPEPPGGKSSWTTSTYSNPEERYAEQVRQFLTSRIEELKAEALFEFSDKAGADVILSPTYSVRTTKSDGLTLVVTVKVKGIPAAYDDVRPITAADRALVDIDRVLVATHSKDVRVLSSTESEQRYREEKPLK